MVDAPRVYQVPDARRVVTGELVVDGHGDIFTLDWYRPATRLDLPPDDANGRPVQIVPHVHGAGYPLVARMTSGAIRFLTRDRRWRDIAESPTRARSIAAHRSLLCAILSEGGVHCWERSSMVSLEMGIDEGVRHAGIDVPSLALPVVEEFSLAPNEYEHGGPQLLCARSARGAVACAAVSPSDVALVGAWLISQPVPLQGNVPPARLVAVGAYDVCVIGRDDRVWCAWGPEHDPPSRLDGSPLAFRRVPMLDGVAEIALARGPGCARWPSGTVRCWGPVARGGAVIERWTPVAMSDIDRAERLVAGGDAWCALQRGVLVCRVAYGSDWYEHRAEVSRPWTIARPERITSASTPAAFLCVTLESGALECGSGEQIARIESPQHLHDVVFTGDRRCAARRQLRPAPRRAATMPRRARPRHEGGSPRATSRHARRRPAHGSGPVERWVRRRGQRPRRLQPAVRRAGAGARSQGRGGDHRRGRPVRTPRRRPRAVLGAQRREHAHGRRSGTLPEARAAATFRARGAPGAAPRGHATRGAPTLVVVAGRSSRRAPMQSMVRLLA